MFASMRCRPHFPSGLGFGTWAPGFDVSCRTWAPLADEKRALNSDGVLTHVVAGGGWAIASSVIAVPMSVPGANGALGKIVLTAALPPPSAAGFVHSTDAPAAGEPSR